MRFAYLIMAHTNFAQVAKLVELLDDSRNDIYIHIDKKVSDARGIYDRCIRSATRKSKMYLVPSHNVMWGG